MTTHRELANWFEDGKGMKAAFMIVVCDGFDYSDYPVYVTPQEDFWSVYRTYDGKNMQRIMEVYDLAKPWAQQTTGRAHSTPPRP